MHGAVSHPNGTGTDDGLEKKHHNDVNGSMQTGGGRTQ
jgi:hypothetical protein